MTVSQAEQIAAQNFPKNTDSGRDRNPAVEGFILEFSKDHIPPSVFHQMRRCLLDLIGVLAAGSTTPLSHIITSHAYHHFAAQEGQGVRLLADGRYASPQGVALAGGMMIDSIDAHDGMRLVKGHAGCGLLPSLVAMLEYKRITAKHDYNDDDLLTNLTLGYEVALRSGLALHQSVADYHTSGAWVALGAAAMTCRLLGASRILGACHSSGEATQLAHALGIAEYHGPRSQMMRTIDHPTMVKDGSGWGAMAGVSAAFLARDGFTGAPAITVTDPAQDSIWSDLGEVWHCLDQYIKPWPVCRWAQPAVTAALGILSQHGLEGRDVAHIEVVSFHEAVRLAKRIPEDTEMAQYSLPWPVAAAVIRGQVQTKEISAPFDDPDIIALATSMTLTEDAGYNAAFPAERLAHVIMTMHDGGVFTAPKTRATWDADAPPSDQDMIDKFHQFADPVMGQERGAEVVARVFGLDPHRQDSTHARRLIDLISTAF